MGDGFSEWRRAARALRRSPLFTIVTVATLSLGIGATTAVYSFVDGVLLSALPYPEAGRIVVVQQIVPEVRDRFPVVPVNLRSIDAWRRACRDTCTELAAVDSTDVVVTGEGAPESLRGARVTPGFFRILGADVALGRSFRPEDAEPGRARVAVLTHGLWQRRYGGDPAVLGRLVTFDDERYEVVGVLPPSFRSPRFEALAPFAAWSGTPEFFEPLRYRAEQAQAEAAFNYLAILRLPPDVTLAEATAELNTIAEQAFRDATIHPQARLRPLFEQVVGEARQPLWMFLAAVFAMLLVASVNVANMLGARWLARRRDVAIRRAIGATPRETVMQALRESLLLAFAGGIGGLVIAWGSLRALVSTVPISVPRLDEVTIDGSVLLVALLVTLTCGVLCALVPAWQASRSDPIETLKMDAPATRRHGVAPSLLVGFEVALGIGLLVVAGLLLSSFVRVLGVDRGFDIDQILAVDLQLPQPRYSDEATRARFYREVLRNLEGAPGLRTAGVVQRLPLEGVSYVDAVARADDVRPVLERPLANYRMVSPEYLRTMGIALTRGRMFTEDDRDRRVIVLSEQTARLLWPGEDPIGRQVRRRDDDTEVHEVVGVVTDARIVALERDAGLVAYLPYWEEPQTFATLVVRTTGDPTAMLPAITAVVTGLDPSLPVLNARPMSAVLATAMADRRFQLYMTGGFALGGLLLVGLGVYGVVASTVERRRSELAIHLALGATLQRVFVMVLGRGLRPVAVGLGVGLVAAVGAGRAISTLLFEVRPSDLVVLTAASAVILGVAITACLVPARRAVRTSPTLVLRSE